MDNNTQRILELPNIIRLQEISIRRLREWEKLSREKRLEIWPTLNRLSKIFIIKGMHLRRDFKANIRRVA